MSFNYKINDSYFNRAIRVAPRRVKLILERGKLKMGEIIQASARKELHDSVSRGSSGALARSIRPIYTGNKIVVGSPLKHNVYLSRGTNAHNVKLQGNSAFALWVRKVFGSELKWLFIIANSIRKKGTKANPFWDKTIKSSHLKTNLQKLYRSINRDLKKILR